MPIKTSPYMNSPYMAQAAANLASLFSPPEAADVANYALADERRAKMNQLSWLFDNPNDPTASKRSSLTGVQGYGQTPEGYRYGVDQTNLTSRENNAADNARLLQTNKLDNQTRAIVGLNGPLNPGQVAPAIPAELADTIGIPVMPERKGAPKPMTEDELKAIIFQNLPDERKQAIVFGNTPVESVATPEGPRIATRLDAIGQQPYAASADKALVEGTAVINGKSVQVYRAPNDSVYKTADGTPVPADIQVFDKAKPTGTNEQLGMKPSEFTTKNGMFGVRSAAANSNMNALLDGGYQPSAMDYEMSSGAGQKNLPTSASNSMISAQGRQFYNAADNFVLSIARPDTGAAISNEEMASFRKMYIPLPGDDPQTIANKRQAREIATAALSANSAGAADQTLKYLEANGVPIPDELRQRLDMIRSGHAGAPQPQSQPQQSVSAPGGIEDGTIIVQPGTDNRMIRRNGKWEPYNG